MSRGIFISYRRSDAQGWAGHLGEALARAFGEAALFFDLESIAPGDDFTDAIDKAIAGSSAVVAVIGPGWLAARLPDGRRRLDDATDLVRIELETALRKDLTVIPLLVGGASMPKAEDLPPGIAGLAHRQALELTDARWSYDFEQLAATIETVSGCARLASSGANVSVEPSWVSVGENVVLEDAEAGDVAGIKAAAALPAMLDRPIDVLHSATITRSKLGDIVGIKLVKSNTDRKS